MYILSTHVVIAAGVENDPSEEEFEPNDTEAVEFKEPLPCTPALAFISRTPLIYTFAAHVLTLTSV
jgi:hypothetical protein